MSAFTLLIKLTPLDLKNIRRDSLLAWVSVLPIPLALLLRWGIPPLTAYLRREVGFDLAHWYPLLMSSFAITMPGMIGTITGFLLLDERDDGVLSALLVTPVSARAYVLYRMATPLVVGFVMTMITYPMVGLTPLPTADLAAAALLGSFGAPFMALFLASFADNKVTGFAMMKMINAVQVLPLVAYFVPMPLQLLVGFLPTYWPMKMIWLAADGEPYGAHGRTYALPRRALTIRSASALSRTSAERSMPEVAASGRFLGADGESRKETA